MKEEFGHEWYVERKRWFAQQAKKIFSQRYLCEDHKRSQIEDYGEDRNALIADEHGETCAMCERITAGTL